MEGMMMMNIRSPDHNPEKTIFSRETITTSTCPSWKLYENPYYYSQQDQERQHKQNCSHKNLQLHLLRLPLSSRKIAASFWDLTFIRAMMESELDIARAQIIELKAELDYERRARKRAESMNKRLAKELDEERSGREALERVCEKLAREVSSDKSEMDQMKREIEEERKMLRVAEVLREERVQMKLTDAKNFLEEKLSEMNGTKRAETESSNSNRMSHNKQEDKSRTLSRVSSSPSYLSEKFLSLVYGEKTIDQKSEEEKRTVLREKSASCKENSHYLSMAMQEKGASTEPENPHIKRGIKGFVEFPRVIRAIRSKSGHWGTKIECQKAQLKILLRQRSAPRSNSLITS